MTATESLVRSSDEDSVTLHVGMIGKNGFVIASDTLRTWGNSTRLNNPQRSAAPKIFCNGPFVCAFAGFQPKLEFLTQLVATGSTELSKSFLDNFASDFFERNRVERLQHEILLGCKSDRTKLWQIKSYPPGYNRPIDVLEIRDKATNEVAVNAHFFPVLLYQPKHTVTELIFLSALTIWYGEKENNGAICGLQVVVCEDGHARELDSGEIEELRGRCAKFNTAIQRRIYGP